MLESLSVIFCCWDVEVENRNNRNILVKIVEICTHKDYDKVSTLFAIKMHSLKEKLKAKNKTLRVDMPFLIDARFYRMKKPQIGNSWARHKQLSESESADGLPILSEFWNLKSEILESDTSSYRNRKIPIAISEKKFPMIVWRCSLKWRVNFDWIINNFRIAWSAKLIGKLNVNRLQFCLQ